MKMYVEVDNKLRTEKQDSNKKDSEKNGEKKTSTFAESNGLSSNARILMEGVSV